MATPLTKGNESKPGIFTTEFYAAVVLPWLITLGDNTDVINVVPAKWQFLLPVISMAASGFYALSRGRAKSGVEFKG